MTLKELFIKIGLEVDEGAFGRVEGLMQKLNLGALGIAAGVAAVAGAFIYAAGEVATMGREVTKAAQRLGIGTAEVQEFNFAAHETGVSAEALEGGIRRLANAVYNAGEGSAESSEAFKQMGVSTKDAAGKLKTPDKLFMEIAEHISKMPDGFKKTALAQKAFGRGGAELIPLLNKGAAGLAELREEAHTLGLVMSEEDLKATEEYTKRKLHLAAVVEGLKVRMGLLAIRGFNALAHWMERAGKVLKVLFQPALDHFMRTLKSLAVTLAIVTLAILIHNAAQMSALAIYSALGIEALAAGAKMVLAWLGAAAPILAIVAAAALVYVAIDDLFTFLEGGDSVIGRFADGWKTMFTGIREGAGFTVAWIIDRIVWLNTSILNLFGGLGDRLHARIMEGIQSSLTSSGHGDLAKFFNGSEAAYGNGAIGPGQSAAVKGAATSAGASTYAPQMVLNQTINAQPGMSPEELMGHGRRQTEEFWQTVLEDTRPEWAREPK